MFASSVRRAVKNVHSAASAAELEFNVTGTQQNIKDAVLVLLLIIIRLKTVGLVKDGAQHKLLQLSKDSIKVCMTPFLARASNYYFL